MICPANMVAEAPSTIISTQYIVSVSLFMCVSVYDSNYALKIVQ